MCDRGCRKQGLPTLCKWNDFARRATASVERQGGLDLLPLVHTLDGDVHLLQRVAVRNQVVPAEPLEVVLDELERPIVVPNATGGVACDRRVLAYDVIRDKGDRMGAVADQHVAAAAADHVE